MSLLQGIFNNLKKVSKEELQSDLGHFLIEEENILTGFKLVRDTVIFTNLRIIDFDKQGATGKKIRVKSIYLDSICEVSCETAGFGLDDSEITISFIKTPYRKANDIEIESKTLEFPKKFNVAEVYVSLEKIAHDNVQRLNS